MTYLTYLTYSAYSAYSAYSMPLTLTLERELSVKSSLVNRVSGQRRR